MYLASSSSLSLFYLVNEGKERLFCSAEYNELKYFAKFFAPWYILMEYFCMIESIILKYITLKLIVVDYAVQDCIVLEHIILDFVVG